MSTAKRSWNISYGYDPNVCHTPILLTLEGHAHIDQNGKMMSCTRYQCVRLFLLKTGICAFEICIMLLVISNVQKEFYRKGIQFDSFTCQRTFSNLCVGNLLHRTNIEKPNTLLQVLNSDSN